MVDDRDPASAWYGRGGGIVAQGTDPACRGAFKQRKMLRLGMERENVAVQGGDRFLMAADDEVATSIEIVELALQL